MSADEESFFDFEDSDSKEEYSFDEEIDEDDHFEVLSAKEVIEDMDVCIREVNEVSEISATTVRILLNHFNWNKQALMERLYGGDQDELFRQAHVVNPYCISSDIIWKTTTENEFYECEICCTDISSSMMVGLECGHRFCKDCWSEYLTMKIMNEGIGQTILCPCYKCDIVVDYEAVMQLVSDSKIKSKYQYLISNNYVESNEFLTWCPKADCTNAIKIDIPESRRVTCLCGHSFCFLCKENVHEPLDCSMIRKWNHELMQYDESNEVRTKVWLDAKTKNCPKCGVAIEKNGGCNIITCKKESCKFEFCWKCSNPLDAHTNLNNHFECKLAPTNQIKNKNAIMENMNKFLRLHNQFIFHQNHLKLENKLSNSIAHTNSNFLQEIVDILCDCRQMLMYNCIFLFYATYDAQVRIFEQNHYHLTRETEVLSKLLKGNITELCIEDKKIEIKRKAIYCKKRREVLTKHVFEGRDRGWWV